MARKQTVLTNMLLISLILLLSVLSVSPSVAVNTTLRSPSYDTVINPYATSGETITYVVSGINFDLGGLLTAMSPSEEDVTFSVTGDYIGSEIKVKVLRADEKHYQIAAGAVLGNDITFTATGTGTEEIPPSLRTITIPAGAAVPIPIGLPGMFFALGSLLGGEYVPDILSTRGSYYFDYNVMDGMPLFLKQGEWPTHVTNFTNFANKLSEGTEGSITGIVTDSASTFGFAVSGQDPDHSYNHLDVTFSWDKTECLLDTIDAEVHMDINDDTMVSSWEEFSLSIERQSRLLKPPEVQIGDYFSYGTGDIELSVTGTGDLWEQIKTMHPEDYPDWDSFYADIQANITQAENTEIMAFDVTGVDGCYIQTDVSFYNPDTGMLESMETLFEEPPPFPVGFDTYYRIPIFNVTGIDILAYNELLELPEIEGNYETTVFGSLAGTSTAVEDLFFIEGDWDSSWSNNISVIPDFDTSIALADSSVLMMEDGSTAQTINSIFAPINYMGSAYTEFVVADDEKNLFVIYDSDGNGLYERTVDPIFNFYRPTEGSEGFNELLDVITTDWNNDGYDDLILGFFEKWWCNECWEYHEESRVVFLRFDDFSGSFMEEGDHPLVWSWLNDMELVYLDGLPVIAGVGDDDDRLHLIGMFPRSDGNVEWHWVGETHFDARGADSIAIGDFGGDTRTDFAIATTEGGIQFLYDIYNHTEWIEGYWDKDQFGNEYWVSDPHWEWWFEFSDEEYAPGSANYDEIFTDPMSGDLLGLITQQQLFADEKSVVGEIYFDQLDEHTYVPVVFFMGDGPKLPFIGGDNGDDRRAIRQDENDDNGGPSFGEILPIFMTVARFSPVTTPDYELDIGTMNLIGSFFDEITGILGSDMLKEQLMGEDAKVYVSFEGDAGFTESPNPNGYVSTAVGMRVQELDGFGYDGPHYVEGTSQELTWWVWTANGVMDKVHNEETINIDANIPIEDEYGVEKDYAGTISISVSLEITRHEGGTPVTVSPPAEASTIAVPTIDYTANPPPETTPTDTSDTEEPGTTDEKPPGLIPGWELYIGLISIMALVLMRRRR